MYAHARQSGTVQSLAFRLRLLVARFRFAIEKTRLARITFRELSALSDRELDDIGVSRADLREVSLRSALLRG